MREPENRVFTIVEENPPVPGCTISALAEGRNGYAVLHFSLAEGTAISAESYAYPKVWLAASGEMEAYTTDGAASILREGGLYVTPQNIPVGVRTEKGCVFTEIVLRKESHMNEIVKAGEVFSLKDLVPYQEGKIVNMDLVHDRKLIFEVMSFAEGTGLTEHAAPGEALIFALEGEGIIGYEGQEYTIKAGENFKFAKNGAHYVKADKPFKMALLLTLD